MKARLHPTPAMQKAIDAYTIMIAKSTKMAQTMTDMPEQPYI